MLVAGRFLAHWLNVGWKATFQQKSACHQCSWTRYLFTTWWKQLLMRSRICCRLSMWGRPLWKGGSAAIFECTCSKIVPMEAMGQNGDVSAKKVPFQHRHHVLEFRSRYLLLYWTAEGRSFIMCTENTASARTTGGLGTRTGILIDRVFAEKVPFQLKSHHFGT